MANCCVFFSRIAVRNNGFDYRLEVSDLDSNLDDNLWSMPSPIDMQDELCDPISDWFATTKETNTSNRSNNNDNLSSHPEISYDIDEALLNSRLMSVPNVSQYKKPVNFVADDVASPPLKPDSTFFHSDSMFGDSRNPTLSENLMLTQPETSIRLPPANSLFPDKNRDSTYNLSSHNQFLDMKSDISALRRVTFNADASPPCTIQSPSITQSNLNQDEKSPLSGIPLRRDERLKLQLNEPPGPQSSSSCSVNTPEVLQPLVGKNTDFDLVSFVFDVSIRNDHPSVVE